MALDFKWKYTIPTEDIIKDVLPEADSVEVKGFMEKVGTVWEMFEIKMDSFTWNVMRSHQEIKNFIDLYNIRFKTKLTLENFKLTGIKNVCQNHQAVNWSVLNDFLETKDRERGKLASFQLLKKSGGRYNDFCCRLPWQWRPRNFVVTSAGVLYYTQPSQEIKQYMPFNNKSFKITCGTEETGYEFGIKLEANHRKLLLYAKDWYIFFRFVYIVKEAIRHLQGPEINPFGSFAPPRSIDNVHFLIDGQKYFQAVYEALQKAEWQIMICGWWVSPEVYLKRPVVDHYESRLDRVLAKAAERDVKIFVLLYNQSSFLTNDSAYAKETLQALSTNIKVLQHPLGILPTFWSHHEKAVIIDQNLVLMGGVDLCFGRYDTNQHTIVKNDTAMYPGIDFNNVRIKDFTKVRQFWVDGVERNKPRLPWHDIGVRFQGQVVQDMCLHFIEYWNYASFQTHYEDRYVLILDKDRQKQPLIKRIKEGIQSKFQKIKHFAGQIKQKLFQKENEHEEQEIKQSKIDEPIKSDEVKLVIEKGEYESDLQSNKRMGTSSSGSNPSDDFQFMVKNRDVVSNKGEEFRQRMLAYQDNNNVRGSKLKSIMELDEIVENMGNKIQKIDYIKDIRLTSKKMSDIPEEEFECQMLRSVGGWSIGCNPSEKETSIHDAYLHFIQNAQHFIYIENQFFVSGVEGSTVVKNQIANALFKRIRRAHVEKQTFCVYIIIPLLPGFPGEPDEPDAVLLRILLHWQYNCISRNEKSLLAKLESEGIDPSQYISFFGLRTHGIVDDKPTTEIVYVHSKLMIIDDKKLIIGSANINDRSMRGSRDSELCLLLEGKDLQRVVMGNSTEDVNMKIRNLRITLWKEHFGEGINFQNPSDKKTFSAIKNRVQTNAEIYRDLFHCYPDDNLKTVKEIQIWRSKDVSIQQYEKLHKNIQGYAVSFPYYFLKDEDLTAGSSLYPDSLSV